MRNKKTMTADEVTTAVRADLKAAVKAGTLPKASYFVRKTWSGHTAHLYVTIKGWTGQVHEGGWLEHLALHDEYSRTVERYTPEAKALLASAEAIANAYNYDESDLASDYFNVGYYLDVRFDREDETRDREMAAYGFRRAA